MCLNLPTIPALVKGTFRAPMEFAVRFNGFPCDADIHCRCAMYRDPFNRLPRPSGRQVMLAVACISVGMFIQMITGGNMVGGSLAAMFCVGGTVFLLSPTGMSRPSVLDAPPTAATHRLRAWVFTGLALAAALAAALIPWEPGSDFDFLGILFLITNIIPVSAICAALVFGSVAVSYWLRLLALK